MARHFVDTSALVKLYRNEPLTTAVQACIGPSDTLVLSGITALEFQSAFFGLVRQNLVSQAHALQRVALLQKDFANFAVVAITQTLVCALEANNQSPLDSVLTTDAGLARCAVATGLVVKP